MSDKSLVLRPQASVTISKTATPAQMAEIAKQLSPREQSQLVQTYAAGNFELASVFVWGRAMTGLKRQLSSLGMEFLAELLDRSDIKPTDPIGNVITDHEALRLAEQLQMFSGTDAMRLRHAMELVAHFSEAAPEGDEDREMTMEEAASVVRACVQSILGHDRIEGAVEFGKFRKQLESSTFKEDDPTIATLLASPQFFRRTTLRVLLSIIKTETGAPQEHALANLHLLLQKMWPELPKPDRWMVGRAYAEVHNAGNLKAATGLANALRTVEGFDFVPENLRSNTFIEHARRLLATHFAYSNFHHEPEPMQALLSLGTTIPEPALFECLTATICVRIGNPYGRSWAAQDPAKRLLDRLRPTEWKYYVEECLPADNIVLAKLTQSPSGNWCNDIVKQYKLHEIKTSNTNIGRLLEFSSKSEIGKLRTAAEVVIAASHGAQGG